MAGTSRVNREVYARFCGRLVVKFHRPTRQPSDDASLVSKVLSKPGASGTSGISRDDTCLRARRQSVYRRHELNTGFGMERENLASDVKGNDKWQTP